MKVQPNNSGTCHAVPVAKKPAAASSMMSTSTFLTKRMMRVLSYLSANWPLVAENSKNGKMKTAPITSPAIAGGNHATLSW